MFIWVFILKACLTGIIGSAFYAWFKTTRMGVWFDKKLDSLMNRISGRLDIEVLKKNEKALKKLPVEVQTQQNRLIDIERRLKKLEEERNLEKELWHKIKANPPRK
jgi:adenylate kinase family enzyme